jgi:hypothetical protein
MDPVSIVVAAFAAGASAGFKETVAGAIKDAYAGLKRIIAERYSGVSTSGLEKKPDSKAQKGALEESLTDAGADKDAELLAVARALLDAIRDHDPAAAVAVGVDLSRIDAGGDIDVGGIRARAGAIGVRATDVRAGGTVKISGVDAGGQQSDHP